MIEIHHVPDTNILEFTISGKIGQAELDAALDAFTHAVDEHGKVNILKEIVSFNGYDDVDFKRYFSRGLAQQKYVGKTALVTDLEWVGWIATAMGPIMRATVKTFPRGERDAALEWLREPAVEAEQPGAVEFREHPDGYIELIVNGHVTKDDVTTAVDKIKAAHDRLGTLRLLEIDQQFDGMDLSALWEDLKYAPSNLSMFSHVAVVSDRGWVQALTRLSDHVISADIRTFSGAEIEAARDWLANPDATA